MDPETAPIHHLVEAWQERNDSLCRAVLRLLLKAGADLEQLDGMGNTALLLSAGAAGTGKLHMSAMRALLAAGADVRRTDSSGDTALHQIFNTYLDHPEAVRVLIEHGCDPNKRGRRGETALQRALDRQSFLGWYENGEAAVNCLLEHGADPNAGVDSNPAVYRAMSICSEVFGMLLLRCYDDTVKRKWYLSRIPGQHQFHVNSPIFPPHLVSCRT